MTARPLSADPDVNRLAPQVAVVEKTDEDESGSARESPGEVLGAYEEVMNAKAWGS
jgi:hypothetical protein